MNKEMRKKTIVVTLLILISILAIPSIITYAGNNNNNDENGKSAERGTGKVNHKDRCRPDVQAGNVWIHIPESIPLPGWITSRDWEGAPCCAHRAGGSVSNIGGDPVYLPNQCCNPPDEGPFGVPGNHCLCFMLRGYPVPKAGIPPT